jgi:hypothetical protein
MKHLVLAVHAPELLSLSAWFAAVALSGLVIMWLLLCVSCKLNAAAPIVPPMVLDPNNNEFR